MSQGVMDSKSGESTEGDVVGAEKGKSETEVVCENGGQ